MATKVGSVGSKIGPAVTGQRPSAEARQAYQQRIKADSGLLQVGFFKDDSARVMADGARVQNPILDGDEDFPSFDEQLSRSMKGLATRQALQLEDFDAQEGGSGLQGFASFLLNKNVTPDQAGVAQLQQLADSPGPQLPEGQALGELCAQLQADLGVRLPPGAEFGQLSLVAGLAMAGVDPQSVLTAGGEIDPGKLSGELAQVMRQGGRALEEAITMTSGINQQVGHARTFIHKR